MKKQQRAKTFAQMLLLGIGGVIFASIIIKVGWQSIVDNMLQIHVWFIPALLVSLLWYMCYTNAWKYLVSPFSSTISFFKMFKAKIAGEAVNTINPVNFVLGDPVRVYMLRPDISVKEGTATVVMDRTLHSISILCVLLLGIGIGFPILDFLPEQVRYGVPVFFFVLAMFVFLLMLFQKKGVLVLPFELLLRLNIKIDFAKRMKAHMSDIDKNIRSYYTTNKRGFVGALCFHIIGRLIGIVEIFIFGHAIHAEFTLQIAILLGALGPLINALFSFFPGAIGIMEGAYGAILYVLGFDPVVGIAIQIARRLRTFIWIFIGLLFIQLNKQQSKESI